MRTIVSVSVWSNMEHNIGIDDDVNNVIAVDVIANTVVYDGNEFYHYIHTSRCKTTNQQNLNGPD